MPKLKARLPGQAWKNGFFSMGSHCSAGDVAPRHAQLAAAVEAHLADAAAPGGMRHAWPHATHLTQPVRSGSTSSALRVRAFRRAARVATTPILRPHSHASGPLHCHVGATRRPGSPVRRTLAQHGADGVRGSRPAFRSRVTSPCVRRAACAGDLAAGDARRGVTRLRAGVEDPPAAPPLDASPTWLGSLAPRCARALRWSSRPGTPAGARGAGAQ